MQRGLRCLIYEIREKQNGKVWLVILFITFSEECLCQAVEGLTSRKLSGNYVNSAGGTLFLL